jgi:polyhydroxybutyrate depolymerase
MTTAARLSAIVAAAAIAQLAAPQVTPDRSRKYILRVPSTVAPNEPAPLVFVFHGGSDTPENTEKFTGFTDLARRERFIVAYPEGIAKSWADGRQTTQADARGVDDIGFVGSMVQQINAAHRVDTKRIYATGPSNGGIFTHRLGCEMADMFAAIAPVIAGMPSKLVPNCKPALPLPIISIQGDADPLTPFEGGEEGGRFGAGGRVEGSAATRELWRKFNGCDASPMVEGLTPRVRDRTSVTRTTYRGCRGDVVWYDIRGGGHRWPPGRLGPAAERVAQKTLGVSSQNLDTTATIWTFFRDHPKP